MSSKTIFFFLSLIILTTSKSLKKLKSQKKAGHYEHCHFFNWCGRGLKCVDYRCLNSTERKNHTEIEYTPNGLKCDIFHHCQDGFKCEQHYCILKNATESEKNATLSQPFYYSYLYSKSRKDDKTKSAKEIVVENLETLKEKITDFFGTNNTNITQG